MSDIANVCVCSHFGAHPFARRVMKIALYSERLTLEQDWEGAISSVVHAVGIKGLAHFSFY